MAMAIGLVVLATLAVSIPTAVIAAVIAGDLELEKDPTALTIVLGASIFLEVFLLSFAYLFSVRKYGAPWSALGLRTPGRGGYWLPGALVMSGLILVYAYFAVLAALGIEPDTDLPEETFDNAGPIVVVAVLSLIFAPVMEEIFFRGFIAGGLRGRWGTLWAALASGLLFASAHIGNPGNFYIIPPITLVGAIFAWGYFYSGSLIAPMIAHFLFNLLSFLVGLATS